MSGAGRPARLALGVAAVAVLVRGAWALAASVARDVALDSPLRVALVPVLLIGLGAGLASRARAPRVARLLPVLAATLGALGGLAWAGATASEAAVLGAEFLVAAAIAAASGPTTHAPAAPRRPAPVRPSRPDEDPPLLG